MKDMGEVAGDYGAIADTYSQMDDNKNAIDFYNLSMEIYGNLKDKFGIVSIQHRISYALLDVEKKKEALDHLQTAKQY